AGQAGKSGLKVLPCEFFFVCRNDKQLRAERIFKNRASRGIGFLFLPQPMKVSCRNHMFLLAAKRRRDALGKPIKSGCPGASIRVPDVSNYSSRSSDTNA
ncbi:MAG TPA: hypothetical protein V6D08_03585, partial [Candidatus Obscuribacterales bacterium]